MKRLREIAINLGVSLGAIMLMLLAFELVVFRFILPGSDLPWNAYVDEVIRYAPNQTGIWRVRNDIAAPFAINAQGWNSGVGDYATPRRPGVERIAVIGDSYVEAFQTPHDKSVTERIAHDLTAAGRPAEAYRFAISGAPMSQYLHIAEREVAKYRPDWIVVLLVGNDYDESFRFNPGRYTSSFRKIDVKDGRVVGEIAPTPWTPRWSDYLRQTATLRFLVFRWQVRPERLETLFVSARARAETTPAVAGHRTPPPDRDLVAVTQHSLGRLAAVAREMGARLLIVGNADVGAVYSGSTEETPERALKRMAEETASALGIAFLDLDPAFARDWAAHRQPLSFAADAHWNERAHALAGEAIARALIARRHLPRATRGAARSRLCRKTPNGAAYAAL